MMKWKLWKNSVLSLSVKERSMRMTLSLMKTILSLTMKNLRGNLMIFSIKAGSRSIKQMETPNPRKIRLLGFQKKEDLQKKALCQIWPPYINFRKFKTSPNTNNFPTSKIDSVITNSCEIWSCQGKRTPRSQLPSKQATKSDPCASTKDIETKRNKRNPMISKRRNSTVGLEREIFRLSYFKNSIKSWRLMKIIKVRDIGMVKKLLYLILARFTISVMLFCLLSTINGWRIRGSDKKLQASRQKKPLKLLRNLTETGHQGHQNPREPKSTHKQWNY